MKRRCNKCSEVVSDTRLVACPRCGGELYDYNTSPPELTPEQEKKLLRSLWRRHWTFLFGGFSVLTVISVITLGLSLKHAYKIGMSRVETNVISRIDAEFQQDRISQTVATVASNQAAAMLAANITPTIDSFRKETQTQLAEMSAQRDQVRAIATDVSEMRNNLSIATQKISSAIAPLQDSIISVRSDQEFLLLSTRAQAYDRNSYTQLIQYASGTGDYSVVAGAVLAAIAESIKYDWVSTHEQSKRVMMGDISYSGPWTSDEIAEIVGEYGNRVVADMIRKVNNTHFLPSLIEMTREETNLLALNRIVRAISELTGKEWNPFALDPMYAWWEEHSHQYTNWPYETYKAGMTFMASAKYQDALSNFNAVIAIDESADKSRAMAAVAALEIGDVDTATNLIFQMHDQNGQWTKWVKAKAVLSTGDVDQATLELHSLATNYPVLRQSVWIDPGSHLYRNINWNLYNNIDTNPPLPSSNAKE